MRSWTADIAQARADLWDTLHAWLGDAADLAAGRRVHNPIGMDDVNRAIDAVQVAVRAAVHQDLVARLRREAALADVPREEPHASHARRLREMADRIEAAGKEGAGG